MCGYLRTVICNLTGLSRVKPSDSTKSFADEFPLREKRQAFVAHDLGAAFDDFVEGRFDPVDAETLTQFHHAPADDLVGADKGIDVAAQGRPESGCCAAARRRGPSLSAPSECSFTGGQIVPSSKMLVDVFGQDPAMRPPTSFT